MTLPLLTLQGAGFTDDRSRVLTGILQALEPMSVRQGGYAEYVGEYAGEIAARDTEEELMRMLLGRSPVVAATVGDARFELRSTRMLKGRVAYDIEIIIASRHLKSKFARQSELPTPTSDPGAFYMLQEVRDRLMGIDLAIAGASAVLPVSEALLLADGDFTVWVATYGIDMTVCQKTPQERSIYPVSAVYSKANMVGADAANPVAETESANEEI